MPRDSRIGGFGSDRIRKSGSHLDQGGWGAKHKRVTRARGLGKWDNMKAEKGNPKNAVDNTVPHPGHAVARGVDPVRGGKDRVGHMIGKVNHKKSGPSNTTTNPLK